MLAVVVLPSDRKTRARGTDPAALAAHYGASGHHMVGVSPVQRQARRRQNAIFNTWKTLVNGTCLPECSHSRSEHADAREALLEQTHCCNLCLRCGSLLSFGGFRLANFS